jgi:ribosome recycling factor
MADAGPLREIRIQLKTRMDKAVEDFRKAMAATRTGRASVHMLDAVSVDYYGSQMPLNQIAQVHAPEPQLITVQPFDPSSLATIEKAIRTADLGLNPMNDGKIIRVPVPPLTEERRKDMVKHLHKMLEEHRTAVRNIRRDGNDAIKKATKDKKIAEDDEKRAMDEIQKLTDDEIKKMEEMSKGKEKEFRISPVFHGVNLLPHRMDRKENPRQSRAWTGHPGVLSKPRPERELPWYSVRK